MVTVPASPYWGSRFSKNFVESFLREKEDWIRKNLEHFSRLPVWQKKRCTRKDYLENKESVRLLVYDRLSYFNQFYGFKWKKITIRDQKSRWGSCSKDGNLNFNYKILFLPTELQDYVIVHELCHLGELNHSQNFWRLVGKTLPDYNNLRKKLRGGLS